MDVFRLIIDGLVLSVLCILAGRRSRSLPALRSFPGDAVLYGAGLIFMVLEVYFIYRGQENSDLFFWHGYLAWTIGNIAGIVFGLWGADSRIGSPADRDVSSSECPAGGDPLASEPPVPALRSLLVERLALWQAVVITVFAGFSLTVGWLMKLYLR